MIAKDIPRTNEHMCDSPVPCKECPYRFLCFPLERERSDT